MCLQRPIDIDIYFSLHAITTGLFNLLNGKENNDQSPHGETLIVCRGSRVQQFSGSDVQ
jgi:hypothetical protein